MLSKKNAPSVSGSSTAPAPAVAPAADRGNQANLESMGGASPDAIAESGFSGEEMDLPFLAELEASFGQSFSDVQAYGGPEAQAANQGLGSKAYTVGNRIAFSSETPRKAIVAHEVAHVVQSQGGSSPEIMKKSGGEQTGSGPEGEADAAAAAVMSGQPAAVSGSSGGIRKWSGHEHRAMGNLGLLKAKANNPANLDTSNAKNNKAAKAARDKVTVAGPANGSFYTRSGTDHDTFSKLDDDSRATGTVIGDATGFDSRLTFGHLSEASGDFVATVGGLKDENEDDELNGDSLIWGNSLEYYNMATNAKTNINHFYPLNNDEYRAHHAKAVSLAITAQSMAGTDMAKAESMLNDAFLEEGFASHFLEDSFAAGHMTPRALDRASAKGLGEDELGLNRSKSWHDYLNHPDEFAKDTGISESNSSGVATSRGRFHGDDTMDSNDLNTVADDVAMSLNEVIAVAQGNKSAKASISLPVPKPSEIKSQPVYKTIWGLMMDDFQEDQIISSIRDIAYTTDGGTTANTDGTLTYEGKTVVDPYTGEPIQTGGSVADRIQENVYGGQTNQVLQITGSVWNGATIIFNVGNEFGDMADETTVYIKWFDQDWGIDHGTSGETNGTILNDNGAGWLHNKDPEIGTPTSVTVSSNGLGAASGPDNDGDAYAVFYSDSTYQVPIGRSNVQGGDSTGTVNKPRKATSFSWSGTTLRFYVEEDSSPATGTVWLSFFDKDWGFDHDENGNDTGGYQNTDPNTGDHIVTLKDGWGCITASGKADNHGNTYAVLYSDSTYQVPIGRSNVQGGGSTGTVTKPRQATSFSWSGSTLQFYVDEDGSPATGRVWLSFFDKDWGFDHDENGNDTGGYSNTDPNTGDYSIILEDGWGSITASGKADNSGDTYAVIYMEAWKNPIGRSDVQP